MISFLIAAGLLSGAGGEAPLPDDIARGGWNSFGYYTPPSKRKRSDSAEDDAPAIVAEIVEAATAPVFRKAAPPKPVPARLLPKAKPVDEKRVHAALEAARREWIERDEDDAIAIALILANA